MEHVAVIEDQNCMMSSCEGTNSTRGEFSPGQLPSGICFCKANKRRRCNGTHLVEEGEDSSSSDDDYVDQEITTTKGCKQEDFEDDDKSEARARKRARIDTCESSIRGCCDGELVARVRNHMLEMLEKRLAQSAIRTLTSSQNNDRQTNLYLLGTIENLLFSTAFSLEEYADITTLDKRLVSLLVALLNRQLAIEGS